MDSWKVEYKQLLKKAETNLHKAEELLRENGVVGPAEHLATSDFERISLPKNYIRTADHFRNDYNLRKQINNLSTRNNISYALQLSDFLNYISNRFNLGNLTVANTFYRMTTSHIFTIIESILCGSVKTLNDGCRKQGKVCKKAGKCDLYFKKPGKYSFKDLVTKLQDSDILCLSQDEIDNLMNLKEIRDRFHMWDTKNSDFHDEKYTLNNYNAAIILLKRIRDMTSDKFTHHQAKQAFCSITTNQLK